MPETFTSHSFHAIILTGPTASGKSAAGLDLAHRINGEIVNADSMQLYSSLPILTAHPTPQEMGQVPHHLYGVLSHEEKGSVGWWYPKACSHINNILARQHIPIIVGGTGMYLMALLHGLAKIPPIPEEIRNQVRIQASQDNFFNEVMRVDPIAAQTLNPQDKQRLARALEVYLATGKSIRTWQSHTQKLHDYRFLIIALMPERELLYQRINDRFTYMVHHGALEEVSTFIQNHVNPEIPITKALGLPELQSYIKGEIDLTRAIDLGQQASRRYAKRQLTWIRHQLPQAKVISRWDEQVTLQVSKDFFINKSIG